MQQKHRRLAVWQDKQTSLFLWKCSGLVKKIVTQLLHESLMQTEEAKYIMHRGRRLGP